MAFGSWFKSIVKGAGKVFNKVLPALKKGAEIVSSVAPVLGSALGGSVGNILNNVGKVAGNISNISNINNISGKISDRLKGSQPLLGVNGAGRFEIPLLK